MPTFPSSQAHTNTLLTGSCKIEYSNDAGLNWVNLGIARGVNIKENWTKTVIQADNAEDIANRIGEQTLDISFNSLEWYPPAFYALRGIDTYEIISSDPTTEVDAYTTGSWYRNRPYYFQNQGCSDTLPAVLSVKSVSTANASDTLESTADYTTFTDANNRSGIIVLSTGVGGGDTGLTSQSLLIEYEYGAIHSYKLKSGGLITLNSKWYRLTNKEFIGGVAKYRYFTIYSGSIEEGFNLAFKSANEADAILETPIMIKARVDSSRTEGDQLYCFEDEAPHA